MPMEKRPIGGLIDSDAESAIDSSIASKVRSESQVDAVNAQAIQWILFNIPYHYYQLTICIICIKHLHQVNFVGMAIDNLPVLLTGNSIWKMLAESE